MSKKAKASLFCGCFGKKPPKDKSKPVQNQVIQQSFNHQIQRSSSFTEQRLLDNKKAQKCQPKEQEINWKESLYLGDRNENGLAFSTEASTSQYTLQFQSFDTSFQNKNAKQFGNDKIDKNYEMKSQERITEQCLEESKEQILSFKQISDRNLQSARSSNQRSQKSITNAENSALLKNEQYTRILRTLSDQIKNKGLKKKNQMNLNTETQWETFQKANQQRLEYQLEQKEAEQSQSQVKNPFETSEEVKQFYLKQSFQEELVEQQKILQIFQQEVLKSEQNVQNLKNKINKIRERKLVLQGQINLVLLGKLKKCKSQLLFYLQFYVHSKLKNLSYKAHQVSQIHRCIKIQLDLNMQKLFVYRVTFRQALFSL